MGKRKHIRKLCDNCGERPEVTPQYDTDTWAGLFECLAEQGYLVDICFTNNAPELIGLTGYVVEGGAEWVAIQRVSVSSSQHEKDGKPKLSCPSKISTYLNLAHVISIDPRLDFKLGKWFNRLEVFPEKEESQDG